MLGWGFTDKHELLNNDNDNKDALVYRINNGVKLAYSTTGLTRFFFFIYFYLFIHLVVWY